MQPEEAVNTRQKMAAPQFESPVNDAAAIYADWNSFVDGLSALEGPNQASFDLGEPIPNFAPTTSIAQFGKKLTGAIALAHSLSNVESVNLIPDSNVNDVVAKVSAVRTIVGKLLAQLNGLEKDNEIVALDSANFTAANQKGQQLNLPPIFTELYPAMQNLLASLYNIRTMTEVNVENGFALQLSQIDAARSAQSRAFGELSRLQRAIDASRKKLAAMVLAATTAEQEIGSIKERASNAVQKAEESKGQAEALIAATTEMNNAAIKVKESVDSYQTTFTKFQADLEARNVAFVKGHADLEKLLADGRTAQDNLLSEKKGAHEILLSQIAEVQKEVDRLHERSRDVLGEATGAGLSASFALEMKTTAKQLGRIQILFFFSVAFDVPPNLHPFAIRVGR